MLWSIVSLLAQVFHIADGISLAPLQRVECTKGVVCELDKDHINFIFVGDTGKTDELKNSHFLRWNYV
jgi:hypothetical protein